MLRAGIGHLTQRIQTRRPATLRAAATAAVLLGMAAVASQAGASSPPGAFTTKGAWSFVSAPKLHPPRLLTQGRPITGQLARGEFLLANFPNLAAPGPMTGQSGPLLVDRTLQPVWFAPVPANVVASDLQQETYQGQPVLVWWQGKLTDNGGTIAGQVIVVDQHYHRLAALRARAPWVISLHDAFISGQDIWVTVYRYVHNQNLAAYGGSRHGTVYDAGVQKYDLRTGKLLYTWDALNPGKAPHVPLSASEQPASVPTAPNGAWDAYHVNSIQVLSHNRILVSLRNTWAAYLINSVTGKTIWTLGGRRPWNSFSFGRDATFAWQHDVELLPHNRITLFDDGCCRINPGRRLGTPSGPSRGLVLRLDVARHRASLVAAYPHRPRLFTAFLGSMQLLPNRNAVVGWGSLPYFSEYSAAGKQLLDVRFPGKDQSYRALFTPTWVGSPSYPPHGAVRRAHGRTTVDASWNGATQLQRWQILAGQSATSLAPVASAGRAGFETAISVRGTYRFFAVRALDVHGQVLGTSSTFS
ncbi:MAG TPA: arylsulfotransferase family protein [Solirubrobacteraceae bacterium]|nr:arylsulfotransferase family protein [Solirubrobacteraceae bacterium]